MGEVLLEIMEPKINELQHQARTEGLEQGLAQGISGSVNILRGFGHSDEEIKAAIIKRYRLSEKEAVSYL